MVNMTFTPEIRRKCMQANKRKDTKPELILRKHLRNAGLSGYRLQWRIPGKPDICYPGKKIAIFVNGCFWHRCPKCHPPTPQTNMLFWEDKFTKNVERDRKTNELLKNEGWIVITIWECDIKNNVQGAVEQILQVIRKNQ